jgi:hypothetical protein
LVEAVRFPPYLAPEVSLRRVLVVLLLVLGACAPVRSFSKSIAVVQTDKGPGFNPATSFVLGLNGTLEVTNNLDKPHGFSISELKIEKVVDPGQTIEVKLHDLKPVDYEYFCQLHDVVTGQGKHQRGVLRVAR